MSTIISRADQTIAPPTVYVPLKGKQVRRVEAYKVGQQCEIRIVGVLKGKAVNATDGDGLSGDLSVDVFRLELTPIDGTFSYLVDDDEAEPDD